MLARETLLVTVIAIISIDSPVFARSKWQDNDCEACRTIVEQFYKGWFVLLLVKA